MPSFKKLCLALFGLCCLACLWACSEASPVLHEHALHIRQGGGGDNDGDHDTPLKLVGERLFRETRFSQYFYTHVAGKWNQPPVQGDPVVDVLATLTNPIDNPYKGQAISCASCHFVDQVKDTPGGGMRAYTDFSRHSFIPDRGDGLIHTPRNAPTMVGSANSPDYFLHHDGEFATPEDLIRASYFGRNLGWLPGEGTTAAKQMANVVRNDDGSFPTETDLGGLSYTHLFAGDSTIPAQFLIPPEYRMDISKATDDEIVQGVIKLVAGYMRSLDFKRDSNGNNKGAPYDFFIRKNGLPIKPAVGESAQDYSQRLAQLVGKITTANWVSNNDHRFTLQKQDFNFGAIELKGLQIFMGRGQCIRCHSAPDFTDHLFHNTGASQHEYEQFHGAGSFNQLVIPTMAQRLAQANQFLPQSDLHPQAQGLMRSTPEAGNPLKVDLGAWNVFGNPDMPHPQARIRQAICKSQALDCANLTDEQILSHSVAVIKTPTLRDLSDSEPYLHTGQMDHLEDVVNFYIQSSDLARKGQIRNADPLLSQIQLTGDDVQALTLFLKSLNEDYD